MKNNKIYLVGFLVGFILILCFSFILQGTDIIINEQDDKDNRNVVPPLTASNSVVYEWNRTWGGGDDDDGYGVVVDSSGNIYLAGGTESFGAGWGDMALVKYDGNGVQQWNRTWGGDDIEHGHRAAVDSLDNVYHAGFTDSYGTGDADMVLVKYDSSGVLQWNRTWGGSEGEEGRDVVVDSSDNVYLAGWTNSFGVGGDDMVLVKYDSSGVKQWNRTWGGNNEDRADGIEVDSLNNVYLAGDTDSFGAGLADMVLVKYDSSGVQQWNRTWGGGDYDLSWGAAVDSSGNVYLAGGTYSFGAGSADMVLVKYDSSGVQQWYRTWGGVNDDYGHGAAIDSSGNVYLAGSTDSFGAGSADMVLVKYDSSGVKQWNHTWGGSNEDRAGGIEVDSSGNVYLAGYTYSFGAGGRDMVLVKYVKVPDIDNGPAISGYNVVLLISLSWLLALISVYYVRNKIKYSK